MSCENGDMNFWNCRLTSKGRLVLMMGACHDKSYPIPCPWVFCKWRCNRYKTRPPCWVVMQIMGGSSWQHSTTLTNFSRDHMLKRWCYLWLHFCHSKSPPCHIGGYWLYTSEDTKYLVCHMISKNHVIEESCNFMSKDSSLHVIKLPRLVAIDTVIVGI